MAESSEFMDWISETVDEYAVAEESTFSFKWSCLYINSSAIFVIPARANSIPAYARNPTAALVKNDFGLNAFSNSTPVDFKCSL